MDPQKITYQAAAIPIFANQICLVTSRRTGCWVIPKGCLEPGKSEEEIALQEAWEEAGLVGHVRPGTVGTYEYEKSRGLYRATVFVMLVADVFTQWPEKHQRRRLLCRPSEAVALVSQPGLQALLKDFITEADFHLHHEPGNAAIAS